jgi:hypothetical protein
MRVSDRAKRTIGGRPPGGSAHDRACLYIRDRAKQFIETVHPLEGGYELGAVELERPFCHEDRIAGYIDLAITASIDPPIPPWWRNEWGKPPRTIHVFFIEVKPMRQSIGETLRQFKHYQHLYELKLSELTLNDHSELLLANGPEIAHWVLATIYRPSVAELAIYQESGILVRTLDAERINSYTGTTLAKEMR